MRLAEQLRDALEEDRGGEGLDLVNFRLLAAYNVPDWARGIAIRPKGLRWTVVATEERHDPNES